MTAPISDKAAIRQVIRALRASDHKIYGGHDGEEEVTYFNASEDDIIGDMTACDSSKLYVTLPDGTEGWILFVLGNEPFEVICDHTTNLSDVLDPLAEAWEE